MGYFFYTVFAFLILNSLLYYIKTKRLMSALSTLISPILFLIIANLSFGLSPLHEEITWAMGMIVSYYIVFFMEIKKLKK